MLWDRDLKDWAEREHRAQIWADRLAPVYVIVIFLLCAVKW